MSMVDMALRLASKAHAGQTDKAGKPYITHPLAVASFLEGQDMPAEYIAAALLHDVFEDTPITIDDPCCDFLPDNVKEALRLLTHDDAVPYMDYIRALKGNEIARAVKFADLTHNSDISRIPAPTEKDYARLERYAKAMELLLSE